MVGLLRGGSSGIRGVARLFKKNGAVRGGLGAARLTGLKIAALHLGGSRRGEGAGLLTEGLKTPAYPPPGYAPARYFICFFFFSSFCWLNRVERIGNTVPRSGKSSAEKTNKQTNKQSNNQNTLGWLHPHSSLVLDKGPGGGVPGYSTLSCTVRILRMHVRPEVSTTTL